MTFTLDSSFLRRGGRKGKGPRLNSIPNCSAKGKRGAGDRKASYPYPDLRREKKEGVTERVQYLLLLNLHHQERVGACE